jgi:hypothetical protein
MIQTNANYTIGYSTQGNTVYGGVGWDGHYALMMGYNTEQGLGYGYDINNTRSHLFHPEYNYNAPEEAAANAYNNAAQLSKIERVFNYLDNVREAANMTMQWLWGAQHNMMFTNDKVALAMKDSPGIQDALQLYYTEGKTTGYYSFGLQGLYKAGFDPIQQFVGGYNWQIHDLGGHLQFTLTNTTSFASGAYHTWPYSWNWEHGPMSRYYQTYIFLYP